MKKHPKLEYLNTPLQLWREVLKKHYIVGVLRKSDPRYTKIYKEYEEERKKRGI